MVGMCGVGLIFLCSFDVTPIALADNVLVHLLLPRCKVVSIEFLCRKSASHMSVHVGLLLLLCDTMLNFFFFSVIRTVQVAATTIGQFFVKVGLGTTHVDGLGSSCQVLWYHVTNWVWFSAMEEICVCVWEITQNIERLETYINKKQEWTNSYKEKKVLK